MMIFGNNTLGSVMCGPRIPNGPGTRRQDKSVFFGYHLLKRKLIAKRTMAADLNPDFLFARIAPSDQQPVHLNHGDGYGWDFSGEFGEKRRRGATVDEIPLLTFAGRLPKSGRLLQKCLVRTNLLEQPRDSGMHGEKPQDRARAVLIAIASGDIGVEAE
jgi:hypothetical protein